MEALNAIRLKPICVLPEQTAKPTKISPSHSLPFFKFNSNQQKIRESLTKNFHGSLAFLGSGLSAKFASALTYEEALEQSVNTNSAADFDAGSVVETIVNNPLLIAGGVALIAVPLVLSQVLGGKPKPFGVQSAKNAYANLADDPNAQLLDIRSAKEVREVGSPDIRALKKKAVSVLYIGDDKPGFLKKLSLKFKDPENTTLYILDKFDSNAELVAELVTANGFKSAYAIKDGAEGPRGWVNSGLPWIQPSKSFSFDFGSLTEALGGGLGEGTEALSAALGIAAAAGLGLFAFTETETVLQLLGSAAIIQVIGQKFLFAEEREKTLQQLDEFLTTKIAPKEIVTDIKQIGSALLPTVNTRALPTAAEPSVEDDTVLKAETASVSQAVPAPESSAETTAQPAPEINAVSQSESKPVSHRQYLSPYPSYPDFKPPTSPCPSQP